MPLEDMCNTYLYSELAGSKQDAAKRYLIGTIAHPDPGSDFDKAIGMKKYLLRIPGLRGAFADWQLPRMLEEGYDVLLLEHPNQEFIGHLAYQIKHETDLYAFSIFIQPEYRGQGLALYLGEKLLDKAREKGMKRIKAGNRGSEAGENLLRKCLTRKDELGVKELGDNWFEI